jgi:hypothetical protein
MMETLDYKLRILLPMNVSEHLAVSCCNFDSEDVSKCVQLLTMVMSSYSLLAYSTRLLGAAAVYSVYRSKKETTASQISSMASLLLSASGCHGQSLEQCAQKIDSILERKVSRMKSRQM